MKNINLVTLKSFVSVENLTVEEVMALIERAEFFKKGGA
ncbi:MAG: aspartate carbamoyltransferase, partial [Lactobacillus sp.]|nr:aspartate carbamoyltransferase [Lactobacillus sp.]